jgi:hypothetical protein
MAAAQTTEDDWRRRMAGTLRSFNSELAMQVAGYVGNAAAGVDNHPGTANRAAHRRTLPPAQDRFGEEQSEGRVCPKRPRRM